MKVKRYDCMFYPASNNDHGFMLYGVTERETYFLRQIHGGDAIKGLKELDEVEIDEREMYLTLADKYGRGRVEKVFKTTLDEFDAWKEQVEKAAQEAATRRSAERTRKQTQQVETGK